MGAAVRFLQCLLVDCEVLPSFACGSTALCLMNIPAGSRERMKSIALLPWICVSRVSIRYMTSELHLWNCQHIVDSLALLICVTLFASDRLPQLRVVNHRSLRRVGDSAIGISN